MREIELKYGCNPNQKPARIYMEDGRKMNVGCVLLDTPYTRFYDLFQNLSSALPPPQNASATSIRPA